MLTPGTDTTFNIGEATVYFPGDSVKKEVIGSAEILQNKSSLPENIRAITDIYSLRLSDPDAYEPDNEGTITFSVPNPLKHAVYASYKKYDIEASNVWYRIGGTVGDGTIEAPIPKGVSQFVVAEEPPAGGLGATTSDSHMRKGPYLILNGSPGSMTVQWQVSSTSEAKATLFWGPKYYDDPNSYPYQAEVISDTKRFFSKQISDLPPGVRTYYVVSIIDTDTGKRWNYHGSFMTPLSDSATTLSFYAYGDTRSYPADHNRVLHYMLADSRANGLQDTRQTFLIHAGDFVARGLLDDSYSESDSHNKWDSEFFYYRKHVSTNEVLTMLPIMGVVGNHEHYYNDTSGRLHYTTPTKLYRYYWNYPQYQTPDNNYYSFDYGPVHFVSLDVYSADYAQGTAQYNWLVADLKRSTKPWKIVMFHHPAYCANTGGSDVGYADTDKIRKNISPILEDKATYGVNLVIQAHEHNYSRSRVNGMDYLMLGGGGAGLVDGDNPLPVWVQSFKKEYNFARIEIDGSTMNVTVLNANDNSYLETIDFLTINK